MQFYFLEFTFLGEIPEEITIKQWHPYLVVSRVNGSDETVIWNVFQMTTEFQPGSSGRNVISCAFALNLDQNWEVFEVTTVPFGERCKKLETIRGRVNINSHAGTICRGVLVGIFSGVESWKTMFSLNCKILILKFSAVPNLLLVTADWQLIFFCGVHVCTYCTRAIITRSRL